VELCDDGNRLAGDGCDRYCVLEGAEGTEVAAEITSPTSPTYQTFPNSQLSTLNSQLFQFPQQPSFQQLPYQLPMAQLQPLIQRQGPIGDTGPAAVAIAASGVAAGLGWIRRRRK
jgi:hypothetical protein